MQTNTPAKRLTMATVKSFIKKAAADNALYIKKESSFDGMVDCVMPYHNDSWKHVSYNENHHDRWGVTHTHGVPGAWFVGQSRDYITLYEAQGFSGFEIYNSCGSFIIARPSK